MLVVGRKSGVQGNSVYAIPNRKINTMLAGSEINVFTRVPTDNLRQVFSHQKYYFRLFSNDQTILFGRNFDEFATSGWTLVLSK